MRLAVAAWLVALLALSLAPLQAWTSLAQTPIPVEDCFDDTASIYPPDPAPGDTVTVRVYSCASGNRILEVVYEEANTGYVHTLVYDLIQGYTMKEYTVTLPGQPGTLKVILDKNVLKQVYISQPPQPVTPPQSTTTDGVTPSDSGDGGGHGWMMVLALAGLGVLLLIPLGLLVVVAARRG